MGRFRRAIAALLALALLVLPGTPMRHASASPFHAMGQAAAHDCVGHGAEAAPDQMLASDHDDHSQTERHSGNSNISAHRPSPFVAQDGDCARTAL